MTRGYGALSALVAFAILGAGLAVASRPDVVYEAPRNYRIERHPDAEGNDRIWLSLLVEKRLDCDIETSGGDPRVEFYDARGFVLPVSPLFRPDGLPAGRTLGRAGDRITVAGYSANVPASLQEGGRFAVQVPCVLYEEGPGAVRVYGRTVVATWGPVPVPLPGQVVASDPPLMHFGRTEP